MSGKLFLLVFYERSEISEVQNGREFHLLFNSMSLSYAIEISENHGYPGANRESI